MSAFALAEGQAVGCEAGPVPSAAGLISCFLAGWHGMALVGLRSGSSPWVLNRRRLPVSSRGTLR